MKGGDTVARELIRMAVGKDLRPSYFDDVNMQQIVQWFDLGGELQSARHRPAPKTRYRQLSRIQGLMEKLAALGVGSQQSTPLRPSAAEFILEGFMPIARISRNEERGFYRRKTAKQPQEKPAIPAAAAAAVQLSTEHRTASHSQFDGPE